MATQTTSAVYIHVIEDVIDKVREEFINNGGPGEGVLIELQELWELKMMQCGVLSGPIERSSLPRTVGGPTPVHDLNVPYEGTEEYETPTAEILFPPTPLQTPIQTPLPGTMDQMYNIPTGSSDFPTVHETGGVNDGKGGRPSPYMQPSSPWMNQRPLGVDVNVAYVEGQNEADRGTSHQPMTQDFFMSSGKRKREDFAPHFHNGGYIPQKDGAGDAVPELFKSEASHVNNLLNRHSIVTTANSEMPLTQEIRASSRIPQHDGPIPDPYEDVSPRPNVYTYQGVVNEDYNIVNTPAANDLRAGTPIVGTVGTLNDDGSDDEPSLNEDDDDDLDDVDQGEEPNTQHLVLAQFEKVTRTKNRWKCTLKDGIMHINNKDVLFNKASGEFDF